MGLSREKAIIPFIPLAMIDPKRLDPQGLSTVSTENKENEDLTRDLRVFP